MQWVRSIKRRGVLRPCIYIDISGVVIQECVCMHACACITSELVEHCCAVQLYTIIYVGPPCGSSFSA